MKPLKTYPLSLSANITIDPGATVEPETTRLQNPSGDPYLIDEIRIKVIDTDAASQQAIPDPHIAVGMSLRLGRMPLTNNFVPIGNFGKVLLDGVTDNNPQGQENAIAAYTWRLWTPLLLAPGEFLVPKFNYTPNLGVVAAVDDPTVNLSITYAGRRIIDPGFVYPDRMVIPWVSSFQLSTQSQVPATGLITDVSNESNLVNMFDTPLFVQRFIGRWGYLDQETLTKRGQGELLYSNSLMATAYTNLRAVDSQGTILARDPIPWTQAFHFPDRSWDAHTTLAPKGFYIFTVDRNFAGLTSQSPTLAVNAFGAISMIGYREVLTK